MSVSKHHIAIVGAGPAGLIAAETLAKAGLAVTVFDRMPSVGRKFLMAGRGGLNLTHSEDLEHFLTRYGDKSSQLAPYIRAFPPEKLIAWCEGLGQPTFIGTSGRVFPKAFKASPLLRAWLGRLAELGVSIKTGHKLTGWGRQGLTFEDKPQVQADAVLLAMGGASWPRLGTDGNWTGLLPASIRVAPLRPANCGLTIAWSDIFRTRFAGQPLKTIALSYDGETVSGDMMVTQTGLEGTPAYTLSRKVRDDISAGKEVVVRIDLRPGFTEQQLVSRLSLPRKRQSLSTFLQKSLNMAPVGIGLVQEIVHQRKIADTPQALALLIKALPLAVTGTSGLERAISSAGGISFDAIDYRFMLKDMPGVFAAGEMLDWEVPTGGYLLQGCFSTGVAAANGIIDWLKSNRT